MSGRDDISSELAAVIDRVAAAHDRTPALIQRILAESDVRQEDIEPFCDWEHPADGCYGRTQVWDGGCFEVIALAWLPGDVSAIHDHGSTRWGAVKVFGAAEHAVFRLDEDDRLTTVARDPVARDSVVPVTHELIHQMGNLGGGRFASLHVYGCDDRTDGHITAGARVFDVDEGAIQRTTGGAFFDLPSGAYEVERRGLRAGFATRLRHQSELAARIARKHAALRRGELRCERGRRVAHELFSRSLWERAPRAAELDARDATILDIECARAARVMNELAPLIDDACPTITETAPCPVAQGIDGFARPFVDHVCAALA